MQEMKLTKTRIRAGMWEGVLSGSETRPELEVLLLERPMPGLRIEPVTGRDGEWAVQVPIPAEVLTDGVQTFLIQNKPSGDTLAHFTIITGVAMEDDLRAEVDLLRQELDMLKRAFRRHCLETMA
ncbi:hypothetical protein [Pseudotabrizicola sp. L79]|uniref:hypothetical protein n=1 Tax=Pseudotabrizicola sp. L79 TaxID=3118402 RepID=UPI002F931A7F